MPNPFKWILEKVGIGAVGAAGVSVGRRADRGFHISDDLADRLFKHRYPSDPRSRGQATFNYPGRTRIHGHHVPWTEDSIDKSGDTDIEPHPGIFRRGDEVGQKIEDFISHPDTHRQLDRNLRRIDPFERIFEPRKAPDKPDVPEPPERPEAPEPPRRLPPPDVLLRRPLTASTGLFNQPMRPTFGPFDRPEPIDFDPPEPPPNPFQTG